VRGARRHLEFPFSTHPGERVVLHQERRVLDRRSAIAGDEQRAFVDDDAVAASLSVDDRRTRDPDQAHHDEHEPRRLQSNH
jgi:hypothetical protein